MRVNATLSADDVPPSDLASGRQCVVIPVSKHRTWSELSWAQVIISTKMRDLEPAAQLAAKLTKEDGATRRNGTPSRECFGKAYNCPLSSMK